MSAPSRAGKAYLFGIGLVIFLAGALFFALMWRSYQRGRETSSWPTTQAVILVSEVEERAIGPAVLPDYRFSVLYGYEVNGKAYTGDRWTIRSNPWSRQREKAEAAVERYPAGSRTICYYDPDRPERAVLKPETKAPGYAIWFPGLFIVGGLGIMIRVVLGGRRKR